MRIIVAAVLTVAMLETPAITSAQNHNYRDRQHDHRDVDRYGGDRRDGDRRDYRDARGEGRFEAGRYYGPRGYAYRSWNIGSYFPRDYYEQRFWIGNPYAYRLPVVYGGARWVRYGPDALLIRLRDGAVLRVVPNRFY
jgi:Ni/Co efflux regulator RcnB